jgi:hypothetical protein
MDIWRERGRSPHALDRRGGSVGVTWWEREREGGEWVGGEGKRGGERMTSGSRAW